jgi:hypothetical protein
MGSEKRLGWLVALLGLGLLCTPRDARAQLDLTGEWTVVRAEDNTGNTELGDWGGIPMSEATLFRSQAWMASIQTLPEWQCRPHGAMYITRGPSQLTITKEIDPVTREVTAWNFEWLRSVRKPVYMDGRPRPSPNAAHTWAGFSLGEWRGDVLVFTTTHIKEEYLKRNGVFHSDRATVSNYLFRRGNYLTWTMVEYDPVYLTEPLVRTTEYQLDLKQQVPPYPCHVVEEVARERGLIPHMLPTDPSFDGEASYFADKYNIPLEVLRSGAATMYPEISGEIERLRREQAARATRLPARGKKDR